MAAERNHATAGPPPTYKFDEVSVSMTRQPGSGPFSVQRINLTGTGNATLDRDGSTKPFHYATKDLLILVNELYQIRFFDLPTNHTAKYSIFIKDDGTIGTSALRMPDQSSTQVCFAVTAYKKCVTYGTDGPRELEEIVQRIFTESDRLIKPEPSGH